MDLLATASCKKSMIGVMVSLITLVIIDVGPLMVGGDSVAVVAEAAERRCSVSGRRWVLLTILVQVHGYVQVK